MNEARLRKLPIFLIDPQGEPQEGITVVPESSEVALPKMVRVLELLGPLT